MSPWWGGVFERLVRSVKRCLKKMLGLAHLSYDELITALVEVEMVLNSRPLTVVSADDLEDPLTPFHLIVGHRLRDAPDSQCTEPEEFELQSDVATKRAKYLNQPILAEVEERIPGRPQRNALSAQEEVTCSQNHCR